MGLSATDYRRQLQSLLPSGAAWPRAVASVLTRVLDAVAQEFARIGVRRDALFEEAYPRTTLELLADWERVAGLPDNCVGALRATVQGRRDDLVAKLRATGGQAKAYYIAIAAELGYEIEIEDNYGVAHEFKVITDATTVTYFLASESSADEPLADWGNGNLECLINKLKPAHTTALFIYVPVPSYLLLNNNTELLLNDDTYLQLNS